MVTPLDGTRRTPLKPPSIEALRRIAQEPTPRTEFNPGVSNLLTTWRYVESVEMPSPYITHKGKKIEFLQISEAGKAFLATLDVPK
jgi:hypothetical protein